MNKQTWQCPVCDYEADSEAMKTRHMKEMTDPAHRKIMEMKVGQVMDQAGEKVREGWENVKDKAQDMADDVKDALN